MKIHSIEREPRGNGACELSHISFVVEDIDVALANAIRRTALSKIPNLALFIDARGGDRQKPSPVIANTCALHNEFLAHRLSLIPVCFSEQEIEDAEGTAKRYKFILKKKNTGTATMAVTTADIEVREKGKPIPKSRSDLLFPVNSITGENVLITVLKPNLDDPGSCGDEVHVETDAVVGNAKRHACFGPVSLCTFSNALDDLAVEEARRIFVGRDRTISAEAAIKRFDALGKDRYFLKNEFGEPRAFTFAIESECRMRPEYIFLKAVRILKDDIKILIDGALPSAKETTNSGSSGSENYPVVSFSVPGFDHTVGNLVQALVFNHHIRAKNSDLGLKYIGYIQPHPLDDTVILKVQFAKVSDPEVARERFRTVLKSIVADILDPFEDLVRESFSLGDVPPTPTPAPTSAPTPVETPTPETPTPEPTPTPTPAETPTETVQTTK